MLAPARHGTARTRAGPGALKSWGECVVSKRLVARLLARRRPRRDGALPDEREQEDQDDIGQTQRKIDTDQVPDAVLRDGARTPVLRRDGLA